MEEIALILSELHRSRCLSPLSRQNKEYFLRLKTQITFESSEQLREKPMIHFLKTLLGMQPSANKLERLAAYELAKTRMLQPTIESHNAEVRIFRRVIEISQNDECAVGCVLASNWKNTARAVIQINKDMTFSKKGPYWTKKHWKMCSPRRFAIALVAVPWSLPDASKPSSQQVSAIPVKILEMDTELLPWMTYEAWENWEFVTNGQR